MDDVRPTDEQEPNPDLEAISQQLASLPEEILSLVGARPEQVVDFPAETGGSSLPELAGGSQAGMFEPVLARLERAIASLEDLGEQRSAWGSTADKMYQQASLGSMISQMPVATAIGYAQQSWGLPHGGMDSGPDQGWNLPDPPSGGGGGGGGQPPTVPDPTPSPVTFSPSQTLLPEPPDSPPDTPVVTAPASPQPSAPSGPVVTTPGSPSPAPATATVSVPDAEASPPVPVVEPPGASPVPDTLPQTVALPPGSPPAPDAGPQAALPSPAPEPPHALAVVTPEATQRPDATPVIEPPGAPGIPGWLPPELPPLPPGMTVSEAEFSINTETQRPFIQPGTTVFYRDAYGTAPAPPTAPPDPLRQALFPWESESHRSPQAGVPDSPDGQPGPSSLSVPGTGATAEPPSPAPASLHSPSEPPGSVIHGYGDEGQSSPQFVQTVERLLQAMDRLSDNLRGMFEKTGGRSGESYSAEGGETSPMGGPVPGPEPMGVPELAPGAVPTARQAHRGGIAMPWQQVHSRLTGG